MKQQRDFTAKQFADALAAHGFEPQGFMGYCQVTEGPAKGLCISRLNAGTTRKRAQLAYLIQERNRWEKKKTGGDNEQND